MKRLLGVFLGVLTAIGGFVDIGDLVTNAESGARFGLGLAWVPIVGVIGICLYAEMAGRVAAVSGRPVFDLIRERLGPRAALTNLFASYFINFLTLTAELCGVSLALQLATSINYLLMAPIVAVLLWLVIWRMKFSSAEKTFGLLGLMMLAFAVALAKYGPDWGHLLSQVAHPTVPDGVGHPTYWYFAIGLFGAAMTPYEVFFFSSGAVEEKWTTKDLSENRINVFLGFPLGGLISLAIMALASEYYFPNGVSVSHLSQVALPATIVLGKLGLIALIIGFFAATFGAALETALSGGYTISQYFGWSWGKLVPPSKAARFHAVTLITIIAATMLALTTIDPVTVTEYSVVLSAAALPLTYIPILLVANDKVYLGEHTNGRFANALASVYLVIVVVASVVTIPLMFATKGGG